MSALISARGCLKAGQRRRPRGTHVRRVEARAAASKDSEDRLPDAVPRCLAVPGSALPLAGLGPRSPPPHPKRRGRARCAGGRARRGLACPRRGGKLSWEKLGAAGASPEVGTGEPSGAREGVGEGGETPRPPRH